METDRARRGVLARPCTPLIRRSFHLVLLAGASVLGLGGIALGSGTVDPLVQVSGPSPFTSCTADLPQFGTNFAASEVEPWVVVNPVDPLNIVGTWQQDRWANGGARGLSVGASHDGGLTWKTVTIPGLTRCTGGTFYRASDPWLSFGPDGTLYHIALAFTPGFGASNGMLVNRSTDGGLTWSPPVSLIVNGPPRFNDKESITADPHDPNFVYAVWDQLDSLRGRGPAVFTRSTDGGVTWGPVRVLYDPGFNNQTVGNVIVVHPDGTLFDFFTEVIGNALYLAFRKSADRGTTWEPRIGAFRVHGLAARGTVDPDLGLAIRDAAFLFDVAVDPVAGTLYAVTQRGGSAGGLPTETIALTMSTDGGVSWTSPVAVNRTPAGLGPLETQAFLPSVHVTANGTIGITYFDFRFNDPAPGALADHWLIRCHPRAADCRRPTRWREELRLTEDSFDILQAPRANGLFIGDYIGLDAARNDFIAFFTQPHAGDPSSAFVRRVRFDDPVDARGAGYWAHQARAHLEGRGRAQVPDETLLEYLEDIRLLYGHFDAIEGLDDLARALAPGTPPSMRGLAERQVLALLLNLTSFRVPPYTKIREQALTAILDEMMATLADPTASIESLQAVKDLAEAINEGDLPDGRIIR